MRPIFKQACGLFMCSCSMKDPKIISPLYSFGLVRFCDRKQVTLTKPLRQPQNNFVTCALHHLVDFIVLQVHSAL